MRDELVELWQFRDLLRQLVARELKVRYKNSVLGFAWSIVPPLLQVIVYTFVFRSALGVQPPDYSAYLLCGMIPWTFLQTALLDSSQSLLINYGIIKKVYMPREVIPLAIVISNGIHFLLGWAVYFVAFVGLARLAGGGIPLLPSMVWFPVITLMELLLVTGLALWVAALNVFYEDVKFILQTLFQLLLFLLPILYPADSIAYSGLMKTHPWLFKLYMLNPITAIITAYRKTLLQDIAPEAFNKRLQGRPPVPLDWTLFAGSCLLSLGIAWAGYTYFNRRKWQFVERL